jgi:nucleoside-triphosphatase
VNLIKNIFLTGKIQVGKSTIINKILTGYSRCVSGFKTFPYYEQGQLSGFYFAPLLKELIPEELPFIGRNLGNNCWSAYPAVFDNLGTRILNACLLKKSSLCIMDELGFFESNAFQFQKKVFEVLRSPIPVLGVIK